MNDLENIREEINKVDRELTDLYEKRMDLARKVADYKQKNNLPIFDEIREQEVIEKNINNLNDPDLKPLFTEFLQLLMNQAKIIQKNFIETNE